jgi:hypothetical protein
MTLWLRTWQLGIKSLLLHPLRTGLTMLGIMIGVWAVIVLTAISQGASDQGPKTDRIARGRYDHCAQREAAVG